MNEPDQGSIVLVDLAFSDQKQAKLRPALVISSSAINRTSRDVIVMKITSKKPAFRKVLITNPDLLEGSLDYTSYVQVDAIYTVEKAIIRDVIGILGPEKIREVKAFIPHLFSLDLPEEK